MINGRGDAYCGMLNCSYNLGMRHLKAYIPEYPVGTAEELADMIADFLPIARAVLGLKSLKIITFGPRPQDFFACNAPIKGAVRAGRGSGGKLRAGSAGGLQQSTPTIPASPKSARTWPTRWARASTTPDLLPRHGPVRADPAGLGREPTRAARQYVAFADKCWPAFPTQFGFEPCYVNSRLVSRGHPCLLRGGYLRRPERVHRHVRFRRRRHPAGHQQHRARRTSTTRTSRASTTTRLTDTFMGFHCGNTPRCKLCANRAREVSADP